MLIGGSPSSRGRGLKLSKKLVKILTQNVALFTRAWIEICKSIQSVQVNVVALFTRAWIEIQRHSIIKTMKRESPSSRGRGLK